MKQKLFCLYNRLKKSFVDEITDIVKHKKGEIIFDPHVRIYLPCNQDLDVMYEEVACLQWDEKEKALYTNINVVEIGESYVEEHEYWTPLRDMSFDELFKIAENI